MTWLPAMPVCLYKYLNGSKKPLETDLTIGISDPETMAARAVDFKKNGVRIIKIKLGRDSKTDIRTVQMIREAVGNSIRLRIDANQGWDFETAGEILVKLGDCDVDFVNSRYAIGMIPCFEASQNFPIKSWPMKVYSTTTMPCGCSCWRL
jgi:O-succinylbenzoate synthase